MFKSIPQSRSTSDIHKATGHGHSLTISHDGGARHRCICTAAHRPVHAHAQMPDNPFDGAPFDQTVSGSTIRFCRYNKEAVATGATALMPCGMGLKHSGLTFERGQTAGRKVSSGSVALPTGEGSRYALEWTLPLFTTCAAPMPQELPTSDDAACPDDQM